MLDGNSVTPDPRIVLRGISPIVEMPDSVDYGWLFATNALSLGVRLLCVKRLIVKQACGKSLGSESSTHYKARLKHRSAHAQN